MEASFSSPYRSISSSEILSFISNSEEKDSGVNPPEISEGIKEELRETMQKLSSHGDFVFSKHTLIYLAGLSQLNNSWKDFERLKKINGVAPLKNHVFKNSIEEASFPFTNLTQFLEWVKAEFDELNRILEEERLEKHRHVECEEEKKENEAMQNDLRG